MTLCFDCIQLLTNFETNCVSCTCKSYHQISSNEFLKNTGISKLAETVPNEVYRSSLVQEFKKSLSEMKQKRDAFANYVNKGKENILEHCGLIKDEIQLKTECLIEAIKKKSFDLIKQVDEYETDCLSNFERNAKKFNFPNENLIYSNDFFLNWSKYLNNYSILEKEISIAHEHTTRLLDLLDKQYDEYKNELLGGVVIKFEENTHTFNSELIGILSYDNINLTKAIDQVFSNQNKVICQKHMMKSFLFTCIDIENLNQNEIFAVTEQINNKILNIFTVDYEGSLIKYINVPNQNSNDKILYTIVNKLDKENGLELIYLFKCFNNPKNEIKHVAKVFDQNLSFLYEKEMKFNKNLLFVYDNNFFSLLDTKLDYKILYVYDENLNEIGRYGQSKSNLPFYFSRNIKTILVNESYFILIEKGSFINILIMNRNDGNILSSIKNVNITHQIKNIHLYMNRFILCYCRQDNILLAYDLKCLNDFENSKKVYELKGKGSNDLCLIKCSNKNLLFYDYINDVIYF